MANSHGAFMREFWLRAFGHDPKNVGLLKEMIQDHPEHVLHTGVAMANLWENMQKKMEDVR